MHDVMSFILQTKMMSSCTSSRHIQLDVATLATVVFTDIGLRCQVECKQHSGIIWMCLGVCTYVYEFDSNEFLVPCQDGDIRLLGGRNLTEGRVEICFNNQWGTVCHDFWDDNDATVVCTQLRLPSEGKLISINSCFMVV